MVDSLPATAPPDAALSVMVVECLLRIWSIEGTPQALTLKLICPSIHVHRGWIGRQCLSAMAQLPGLQRVAAEPKNRQNKVGRVA